MALGMDDDALLPGQLYLHRPLGQISDKGRLVLNRHILLAAKASAHQLVLHDHLFRGESQ